MNHGTVLLADRHSPMLEGIRSLLEERFESVVMVADESSLLRTTERLGPDVAMVDVSFPLTGGRNVIAVLRDRFPELKLIALSIHDDPVAVERILSSGAAAFVLKRTATTDLLPALQEVFAGRVYVSPAARASLQGPHENNRGPSTEPATQQEGLEEGA